MPKTRRKGRQSTGLHILVSSVTPQTDTTILSDKVILHFIYYIIFLTWVDTTFETIKKNPWFQDKFIKNINTSSSLSKLEIENSQNKMDIIINLPGCRLHANERIVIQTLWMLVVNVELFFQDIWRLWNFLCLAVQMWCARTNVVTLRSMLLLPMDSLMWSNICWDWEWR